VNGVDEEFRRDARLALVLAEAEQPEAGDDDDRRIAVAQRRRSRLGEPVVVRLVVRAVLPDAIVQPLAQRCEIVA
jgi:hypothetical protein